MSDFTNSNIPGGAPFVDSNGQITQVWYQFLLALFNRTGGTGTPVDITSLQKYANAIEMEANTAVPLPAQKPNIAEGIVPVQRPQQPDFSQQLVYSPPAQYAIQYRPAVFTTLTATGAFTPSQTLGIVGTTTNNDAVAGSVGEYLTASGSGVSMLSGAQTNVATLALSAGDWEVSGNITFTPTGQLTSLQAGCNSVSVTLDVNARQTFQVSYLNGASQQMEAPITRIKLPTAASVYLVGLAAFTTGTVSASGLIRARRPR